MKKILVYAVILILILLTGTQTYMALTNTNLTVSWQLANIIPMILVTLYASLMLRHWLNKQ